MSRALSQAERVLGDYELVRRLATGGMAEVFEARRVGAHGFSKRFAVKRILPQLAQDERHVSMFCDEARIHASLSHPNLVEVVDFGEQNGVLYMVMEYVDGLTCGDLLSALAARRRTMDIEPALYVAHEVAVALEFVHEARDETDRPLGIVHRDVAPSNILLSRAGDVKLADFGILRSSTLPVRTAPGELKGKVGYVSPEQAIGAPLDPRSDLFSLAVVLSELLICRPLFPGQTELEILNALRRGEIGELRRSGRHIPNDVMALVLRALSTAPGQRQPSAAAFRAEIEAAMRQREPIDADGFASWLSDLGLIALDSEFRAKRPSTGRGRTVSFAGAALRADCPTPARRAPSLAEVERLGLRAGEIAIAERAQRRVVDAGRARQSPEIVYRVRRGRAELEGAWRLSRVLELIATGGATADVVIARGDGAFQPVSSFPELQRLAARPAFRFSDFVGLRATERHPIARGSLPRHVFDLVHRRRSGLLCARSPELQVRAYFVDGEPAFVSSTRASDLIGARLVAQGSTTAEEVNEALVHANEHGLSIGEALIALGAIGESELIIALAGQRRARLAALFAMRGGELLFVDGERSGQPSILPLGSPLSLVARAVLDGYSDDDVRMLFRGAQRVKLVRAPNAGQLIAALELGPQEAYALGRAGYGETLGELVHRLTREGSAEEGAVQRAVLLGLSCSALSAAPT